MLSTRPTLELSPEEAPEAYKNVADVGRVVDGARIALRVAPMRPIGVITGLRFRQNPALTWAV